MERVGPELSLYNPIWLDWRFLGIGNSHTIIQKVKPKIFNETNPIDSTTLTTHIFTQENFRPQFQFGKISTPMLGVFFMYCHCFDPSTIMNSIACEILFEW